MIELLGGTVHVPRRYQWVQQELFEKDSHYLAER